MSSLTAPVFEGDVVQCQDVVVSWTGGEYPVRVEAFYQPDATSDWKIAGLPSEAADSNVIRWQANVPAGTYAWITIIDHTGTYRQSPQGVLVKPSNDDSCIAASASASVVTQTVFMSGDGSGSEAHLTNGLDDKALLILSVCFGILAFGALALAVFLYSRLRQARRARMRGPRFPLVDEDFTHGYAGVNSREVSLPGSALGGASGVAFSAAAFAALANRRDAEKARENRHTPMFEKLPPSPDASHGEHNPFLDPPLSANSDTSPSGFGAYSDRPDRRSSTGTPTLPAGAFLNSSTNSGRPDMQRRTASRTDTMTSATSMQYLFDTRGQLRVANDPTQIETPVLSREVTRNSDTSPSRYSRSTHDGQSENMTSTLLPQSIHSSSRRSSLADASSIESENVQNNTLSNDGHSLLSAKSARTDATADHYTSEPHSSRGWLNPSRQANKQ